MKNFKETIGGVAFTMVYIQGGTFPMGDAFGDGYGDERNVHDVELDGYYMAQTPVTQALWLAVMGNNPSHFKNGGEHPVEMVSWHEAQAFIQKLNEMTGKKYCLPTEAQWEFAAREGGKKVRFGNGRDTLRPTQANFDASKACQQIYSQVGEYRAKSTPVKAFLPNALGLYDLSGNVWEWCQDLHGKYPHPIVPANEKEIRSLRGGSCFSAPKDARASARACNEPTARNENIGFRLALPGED